MEEIAVYMHTVDVSEFNDLALNIVKALKQKDMRIRLTWGSVEPDLIIGEYIKTHAKRENLKCGVWWTYRRTHTYIFRDDEGDDDC